MIHRREVCALEGALLAAEAWQPDALHAGGLDRILDGPGVARRRTQVVGWESSRSEDILELVAAWARVDEGDLPVIATAWAIAFRDPQGRAHRTDGPALIRPDGHREWCVLGQWHRTDGPAIITAEGSVRYLIQGRRHRTDGPAIWSHDGTAEWWVHGVLHRTDGPALVRPDGSEEWWLAGEQVTRADVLGGSGRSLAETVFS